MLWKTKCVRWGPINHFEISETQTVVLDPECRNIRCTCALDRYDCLIWDDYYYYIRSVYKKATFKFREIVDGRLWNSNRGSSKRYILCANFRCKILSRYYYD